MSTISVIRACVTCRGLDAVAGELGVDVRQHRDVHRPWRRRGHLRPVDFAVGQQQVRARDPEHRCDMTRRHGRVERHVGPTRLHRGEHRDDVVDGAFEQQRDRARPGLSFVQIPGQLVRPTVEVPIADAAFRTLDRCPSGMCLRLDLEAAEGGRIVPWGPVGCSRRGRRQCRVARRRRDQGGRWRVEVGDQSIENGDEVLAEPRDQVVAEQLRRVGQRDPHPVPGIDDSARKVELRAGPVDVDGLDLQAGHLLGQLGRGVVVEHHLHELADAEVPLGVELGHQMFERQGLVFEVAEHALPHAFGAAGGCTPPAAWPWPTATTNRAVADHF